MFDTNFIHSPYNNSAGGILMPLNSDYRVRRGRFNRSEYFQGVRRKSVFCKTVNPKLRFHCPIKAQGVCFSRIECFFRVQYGQFSCSKNLQVVTPK